jgi:hypothetical protein
MLQEALFVRFMNFQSFIEEKKENLEKSSLQVATFATRLFCAIELSRDLNFGSNDDI